jgi:hypothetical protein
MDKEQIKKIIDAPLEYDETKEDTLWSMLKEFYGKKMRWIAINIWVWFIIFLIPLIFSIVKFFKTEQTKYLIMYAAIFVCCVASIGFIKVLGWVMLSKHLISREIKRLELRIAKLNETVNNK